MDRYKKKERPLIKGLAGATGKSVKSKGAEVKKARAGAGFSKRDEKYRRIVEEAKEGICVAQDGKLRFINPAMANLLAYPRKGLVSQPFASFVHPDDLKMVLENHLRRSRGEEAPSTYQFRLVDKNENTKWVETKSVRITWNDRPATLNLIDDITRRKDAEENLRESEERWQFALEGSGDGAWDWNVETNKIHYSRQCKVMLGYEESEFGDSLDEWAKRVHPDDYPGAMAEIDKHFRGETSVYTSEHRILCKGGKYKWFLVRGKAIRRTAAGKPLRVIGTRTDVTEHKEKESALRMFQHSIDSASDAVFWMNRDAGFTYVNAQACRSLAYTREELLDLHLWDRRKDGSTFPVEVISDHLWIDQTELHVAYVRDITERKQAEEALQISERDAQALLQETAIMGEIGRIISSTLDIGEVYERFAAEVKKLVPFDRISIVEASPAEGWGAMVYDAGIEVVTRRSGDHFPLAGSVTGLLLQNQSGLIVQGRAMEEFSQRNPGYLPIYQAGFRSMMAVPLILRDQFVGTLGLNSLQQECYSEHHLKIAERIGNHIAGAVANARLFSQRKRAEAALKKSEEEARRLAQENAIMAEIGRIVGSTWDIRTVYDRFGETVRKLIPFDRMAINIPNPERKTFMIPYVSGKIIAGRREGVDIPLSGTIVEEVVRTRSGILVRQEELKDYLKRFPGLSVLAGSGFTSMLSVPLISKEEVIGVLNLQLAEGCSYEEADLKLAEKVGAQIAGAIANAQLFAERQQVERALRDSEEKYRLLVQNAKDAIFIIQNGVIKFSNLQTEKLFEYSAAELAAIPFSKHIHPADRESTQEGNPEGLEAGKYPQSQSFRIRN
ncbi:MAG: diguanylate cyclase with and sensor, partial [Deltaproteobacteria bacterium]|nr:diguanylate cyclase with and sensor [Deltaproteobacteria bacterium]